MLNPVVTYQVYLHLSVRWMLIVAANIKSVMKIKKILVGYKNMLSPKQFQGLG